MWKPIAELDTKKLPLSTFIAFWPLWGFGIVVELVDPGAPIPHIDWPDWDGSSIARFMLLPDPTDGDDGEFDGCEDETYL
jgi:hypothetical protein